MLSLEEFPDVRRLGPRRFLVCSEYVYTDEVTGRTVRIPAGFVCDGASIPRPLWRVIAPDDLSEAAWLLHDWLYRHGGEEGWSRAEADDLLYRVNLRHGFSRWKSWLAYKGVRVGGSGSWRG